MMSADERRPLLARQERKSAPPTRRLTEPTNFSPGGQSWLRKISDAEQARTPEDPTGYIVRGPRRSRHGNSTSSNGIRISDADESDYLSESEGRSRRPYHYARRSVDRRSIDRRSITDQSIRQDPVEEAHYRRYQYYTRLQNQTGQNLDLLNIPDHVIPSSFFQVHIPGIGPSSDGKQSSLITVFAIWNTMMGTSLLSMPWAVEQAGLALGLMLTVIVSGLCLYTAHRILQVFKVHSRNVKISEFPEMCGLLLGRWAEWLATAFGIMAVLGAAVVYWVLMSNFLFNTVNYTRDRINGVNVTNETLGVYCPSGQINISSLETEENLIQYDGKSLFEKYWSLKTSPLLLVFILYPITNFKSATFFTKFNSLGTVSILYIFSSVMYRCYEWGLNADFTDSSSSQYIPLYRSSFPSLTGILALGLFIHNAIITIMGNNRNQEKNGRDLGIAYFLVTTTYIILGAAFYISFPMAKSCIEDNFLNNFRKNDILTVIARIFLFFQMLTVFPLIMYILRVSFFFPIFRSIWPGVPQVLLLNAVCVVICVLFAVFMPKIGTIIRFSGAACGLVIIFALPLMVYMASEKRTGQLSWMSIFGHSVLILLGADRKSVV